MLKAAGAAFRACRAEAWRVSRRPDGSECPQKQLPTKLPELPTPSQKHATGPIELPKGREDASGSLACGGGWFRGRAGGPRWPSGQLTATILPEAEIALTARVDCLTALRNMIKEVGLILWEKENQLQCGVAIDAGGEMFWSWRFGGLDVFGGRPRRSSAKILKA